MVDTSWIFFIFLVCFIVKFGDTYLVLDGDMVLDFFL